MPEVVNPELRIKRFISQSPAAGVLAAIDGAGAAVNLIAWDPATGDVAYSAPVGTGANTRRHLFDRPIVSTSTITAVSFTGAISGNADSATRLQTARNINGVAFDGTANITIAAAAGTLTGATLAAGVLASSLTSTGVLAASHLTSPVVDSGGLTVTAGGITVVAGTSAFQAVTATSMTGSAALSGFTSGAFSGTLSTTAALAIASGQKFYIDGVAATGDTYLVETAANSMQIVAGGVVGLGITATQTSFAANDAVLGAAKKFYVDGGGDTYLWEAIANQINVIAGGTLACAFNATQAVFGSGIDVIMTSGKKFYPDSGGDTYIWEQAANRLEFVVGGTLHTFMQANEFSINQRDFWLSSGKKLYVDGGGDSYIYESAANIIDFWSGAVHYMRFSGSVWQCMAPFAYFANVGTTASAANAFLNGADNNSLLRSTSTQTIKRGIVDHQLDLSLLMLRNLRVRMFQSLAKADAPARHFVGFVSEEVFAITREDGRSEGKRYVTLTKDRKPDGVVHALLTAPLVQGWQYHEQRIATIDNRLNRIEAFLTERGFNAQTH